MIYVNIHDKMITGPFNVELLLIIIKIVTFDKE